MLLLVHEDKLGGGASGVNAQVGADRLPRLDRRGSKRRQLVPLLKGLTLLL